MTIATDDPALDDALARISDLAGRLWAVRQAHSPVAQPYGSGRRFGGQRFGRQRFGRQGAPRCGGCGQASPCPTLRAAG